MWAGPRLGAHTKPEASANRVRCLAWALVRVEDAKEGSLALYFSALGTALGLCSGPIISGFGSWVALRDMGLGLWVWLWPHR